MQQRNYGIHFNRTCPRKTGRRRAENVVAGGNAPPHLVQNEQAARTGNGNADLLKNASTCLSRA